MEWEELLKKPDNLASKGVASKWFFSIAQFLLNSCYFIVSSQLHRFLEIEFYCFTPQHPDIYAHRNPLQLNRGLWYFHRMAKKYNGGSFKGLDLTFGDETMYGGILIRTIETPSGKVICGPSLCVDYLLTLTNAKDLATLDEIIGDRQASDLSNILHIQPANNLKTEQIYTTARIGLSLKKAKYYPTMPDYLLQPYRYLISPQKISKGKVHLIMALHREGLSVEEIKHITGSPHKTIVKYIADFEDGQLSNFSDYFGKELTSKDLCRLHRISV